MAEVPPIPIRPGALEQDPPEKAPPPVDAKAVLEQAIAAEAEEDDAEGTEGDELEGDGGGDVPGTDGGTDPGQPGDRTGTKPGQGGDKGGTAGDNSGTAGGQSAAEDPLERRKAAIEKTEYARMAGPTGAPLFDQGELELIARLRKTLRPGDQKKRKKLLDRASEWRAEQVLAAEREHLQALAAAATAKAREGELNAIRTLSGREPYRAFNHAVGFFVSIGAIREVPPEVLFADDEIESVKNDTATVLAESPRLARLFQGGESPKGRLFMAFIFMGVMKFNAYKKRTAAAPKALPAPEPRRAA